MPDQLLFWEDFTLGRTWQIERPNAVTHDEIIDFACEFDPLQMHVDAEQALNSPLGLHCASGVHTLGMAQRMLCDVLLLKTHLVVGGRIDGFVMLSPVTPGSRLKLSTKVIGSKPHRRKKDQGWVTLEVKVSTADLKTVLVYEMSVLIMRNMHDIQEFCPS